MAQCDPEVFKYGKTVGIYDIKNKDAEQRCKKLTELTGIHYDFYNMAGRVVVKALNRDRRRIVCAANRSKNGDIVLGVRHWDRFMRAQVAAIRPKVRAADWEQGFIDQFGCFVSRQVAMLIAEHEGQVIRDGGSREKLYSEHLY